MPVVTGPLSTTATTDVYPTHDSDLGLGGLREVNDHTERNAIPNLRRREGMVCYTANDGNYWRLLPLPWNGTDSDWDIFSSGSGGGGTATPVVVNDVEVFPVTSVSDWSQEHGFYYPDVQLVDALNKRVYTGASYPDPSTVDLHFDPPFTGIIILRNSGGAVTSSGGSTGTGVTPTDQPGPTTYPVTNASVFSHSHPYPYDPDVQLVDADNNRVYVAADYPDSGTVTLSFPYPFTGIVIMR